MFQCRIDVLLPFSNPATSSSLDRPLHWHLSRSDELPLWALSQGLEEVSLSFTMKCLCHTTHFFQMQNWCVRFWRCVWVSAEQQSCDTSRTEQRWHLQLKCHHNCQTWVNISGRQIFLQPPSLQWWVNKVSVQRTTPEPLVRWRLGESSGNNHCFQFCQYLEKSWKPTLNPSTVRHSPTFFQLHISNGEMFLSRLGRGGEHRQLFGKWKTTYFLLVFQLGKGASAQQPEPWKRKADYTPRQRTSPLPISHPHCLRHNVGSLLSSHISPGADRYKCYLAAVSPHIHPLCSGEGTGIPPHFLHFSRKIHPLIGGCDENL